MSSNSDRWEESDRFLRSLTHLPGALATADVLGTARPRWENEVVPRTSMHDLLFTRPADVFPWPVHLRVSVTGEFVVFSLREPDRVVAEDRCPLANAQFLLTDFLNRLITWP